MRSLLLTASWLVLCLLGMVRALSASGNRLLVVLDELADKDKYTKFWSDLEDRGFSIAYSTPKSDPPLFKHDERTHDHILLFPSQLKSLGPALTPNILLNFMKNDGNILLALSASTPTPNNLISLLLEFDLHLNTDKTAVVADHFSYDILSAKESHDVLIVPQPGPLRPDVKNYFGGNGVLAVPRASGQVLGTASPLLAPVLKAPSTAYMYNPKEDAESASEEDMFETGSQLALVSTLQARNSARFTLLGSVEMLQDKWFDANVQLPGKGQSKTKTANREFAKQLSGWTFQELGVLRVGKVTHFLNEGLDGKRVNSSEVGSSSLNPSMYRIKNDVTFSIELSEYASTHLTPYTPPAADAVQLEFTMLSPYHRLTLTPSSTTPNSTVYSTSFRLPDQHGIFNFRVNYKRPFLTYIDEKRTVTVRHFAHDEWPRSFVISGSWVWIVGIWGTIAGWLAFIGVWLFSAQEDKTKKTQ